LIDGTCQTLRRAAEADGEIDVLAQISDVLPGCFINFFTDKKDSRRRFVRGGRQMSPSFKAQCRWAERRGPQEIVAGFQITEISEDVVEKLHQLIQDLTFGDS
jgi:hypothetical protein